MWWWDFFVVFFFLKPTVETFISAQVCWAYIFEYGINVSWPRWKLLKSVVRSILFLHINCEQDYTLVCHSSCSEKRKKKKKERGENRFWIFLSDKGPAGWWPKLLTPLKTTTASDIYYRAANWHTRKQQKTYFGYFFHIELKYSLGCNCSIMFEDVF